MDVLDRRTALVRERERLAGVRDALMRARDDAGRGSAAELSHLDQHQADDASDLFELERELSLLARVRSDLAEVDDALNRLANGTYGCCEACSRSIPEERLDAVPATRFCVEHEAMSEGSSSLTLPGGWRYADRGIDVDDRAGREAEHLEFLPADDEDAEHVEPSAEEAAVHATDGEEPGTLPREPSGT